MIKLSAPSPPPLPPAAGKMATGAPPGAAPRGEDGGAGKIGGSHIREERKMG
jgi:hypothetical protein